MGVRGAIGGVARSRKSGRTVQRLGAPASALAAQLKGPDIPAVGQAEVDRGGADRVHRESVWAVRRVEVLLLDRDVCAEVEREAGWGDGGACESNEQYPCQFRFDTRSRPARFAAHSSPVVADRIAAAEETHGGDSGLFRPVPGPES